MTAFSSLAGAEEEFCKIFRAKSGNVWTEKDNFQKKLKKYRLVKFDREQEASFVKDFYSTKTDQDYPVSTLEPSL